MSAAAAGRTGLRVISGLTFDGTRIPVERSVA